MTLIHVANAFVDGDRGGNPAGLVLDADALTAAQKQRIAAAAGFSETAFVSASRVADFKLEFFTPSRQIAHCGHATIAAFCILRSLGRVVKPESSKETIDGIRRIVFEGDAAFMEQRAPRYTALDAPLLEEVRASLRLPSGHRWTLAPAVVDTGNAFLILPFESREAVAALRPDFDAVARLSETLGLVGFYPYGPASGGARRASARMFAPRFGIREESATGMAAGPLACFLRDRAGAQGEELAIEQGTLMSPASPSVLIARLAFEDGRIRGLLVGGRAAISGTIEAPE